MIVSLEPGTTVWTRCLSTERSRFLGSSPVGTSFNSHVEVSYRIIIPSVFKAFLKSNLNHYLWIFLQFQGLLINILALVRNHQPRIQWARFFSRLQKTTCFVSRTYRQKCKTKKSMHCKTNTIQHKKLIWTKPEERDHRNEEQWLPQVRVDTELASHSYSSYIWGWHKLPLP